MISKIKYYFIFLIFIFLDLGAVYGNPVRILIFSKEKSIYFSGQFSMLADEKKVKNINDDKIDISAEAGKIKIGQNDAGREFYFKNESGGFFKIGPYKYKGDLKIILKDGLYFINFINVEEYLQGVLPNEISPGWAMEVLKAQAVAARTFTYYFMENNKNESHDLTDTTYSQVYKGFINENENFNKAILNTKDQVMVFQNTLIQAFFHSACGGYTENAENVWGKALPYLKGIPCTYCSGSSYYQWDTVITEDEILKKLKEQNHDLEKIRSIQPVRRSSSGRWIEVRIVGTKKTVTMPGNDFRIMCGISKLRSTKFNIQKRGNEFIINGKGWGHGVGLCQWGAKKMAEKGYKYYQILTYYYRGSSIRPVTSLKN